jgi:poly-gamma-glutamate synthesis protein (capsule biosynthesis protein)
MVQRSLPVFDALIVVTIALAVALGQENASGAAPRKDAAPKTAPTSQPRALTAPPKPEKAQRLVVVAGGDVNFGRECGQAILTNPSYDPFQFVEPLFRDADLTFVNLESQLSDQKGETQSPTNRLIFTGPPGGADVLARAGIDVVSTANNHAWDYGRSALFETIDNLARTGVANVGTGKTFDAAYAPAVLRARGYSVAIFAVTHVWNQGDFSEHDGRHHVAWARLNLLRNALKQAKKQHDLVLFSYHGGAEYIDAPPDRNRRFIESVMATGFVDAVIGHHPHVPQGVGWYAKRPAFYSLGNFVFAGHDWAPRTKVGYLARLELDENRSLVVKACPYSIEGHLPKPVGPKDPRSGELRSYLRLISTSVGGTRIGEPDDRGCWDLSPPR